jgi:uncharacterized membrane protein
MERVSRNVLAGLLAIVPILVTVWIVWFILDLLARYGRPFSLGLARAVRTYSPEVADILVAPWFQTILALLIVFAALYVLGALANAVLGRRVIRLVDRLMVRVPLVSTVYGATRRLIESIQKAPREGQRVVLIEFPQPGMRAMGFVTSTFKAADTGEELAAVYVPTTPNPTSGYVEIVPADKLVWLDWTANEAMAFIVSGGAMRPRKIRMNPESAPPPKDLPGALPEPLPEPVPESVSGRRGAKRPVG